MKDPYKIFIDNYFKKKFECKKHENWCDCIYEDVYDSLEKYIKEKKFLENDYVKKQQEKKVLKQERMDSYTKKN
jgi:hypothetical protein